MRRTTSGFTIIELLVVIVILGILAMLALPKLSQTKERAVRASMVSDLKNLVAAQEGYYSLTNDYAGGITSGPQVIAAGAAGRISAIPSPGNVIVLSRRTTADDGPGWSATVTNPQVTTTTTDVCGIYMGYSGYSPDAKVTSAGIPACY